jgi:hypothetical protein
MPAAWIIGQRLAAFESAGLRPGNSLRMLLRKKAQSCHPASQPRHCRRPIKTKTIKITTITATIPLGP